MLSRKSYWIILILGLSIFNVFNWIWIWPIAPEIGVNLFTDTIFMIVSIIFLTWIIELQERTNWKKVKSIVLNEIGTVLSHIFRSMVLYYENGMIDWFRFIRLSSTAGTEFSLYLDKLLNKEIAIDHEKIKWLMNEPYLMEHHFLVFADRLNNIESKYFKFLSPEIIGSIIKIQKNIFYLNFFRNTYDLKKKVINTKEKALKTIKEGRSGLDKFENLLELFTNFIEEYTEEIFLDILKEILNLKNIGIKIF